MPARWFTLDEANALIPRLEMLMERLQRTVRMARGAASEAAPEPAARATVDVLRVRQDPGPYVSEIERIVGEIESLGCEFKDAALGLVDFPAMVEGRPALLCWQYGEKSLGFWHAQDEGFAGRRALASGRTPSLQ
ncbi:MAG: DUF2203 domain-containing protein [Deltaproteobacteria bacterium]|nr:DUF2203 domain-containing protein [Deltaproteobacteria bacterium]